MAGRTISIIERDGNVYHLIARGPKGEIEVITNLWLEGGQLILTGTHIEGSGPGSLGVAELREFARELGRRFGAHEVVVLGGVRTTGANVGHTPRPIRIKVE